MIRAVRSFASGVTGLLVCLLAASPSAVPAAPAVINHGAQVSRAGAGADLAWTVNALSSVGCAEGDIRFAMSSSGTTGAEYWNTRVTVAGKRYMNQTDGPAYDANSLVKVLVADDTGGPTTADFPLPPDEPVIIDFQFVMAAGASGPVVFHRRVVLDKCNGGSIDSDDVVPEWDVLSLDSVGCDPFDTTFLTRVSGLQDGTERWRTIVDANGKRYMDEEMSVLAPSNGEWSWSLTDASSGGPVTASFPLPEDTPITIHFDFIQEAGGPAVYSRRVELDRCNGGSITSNTIRPEWHFHSLSSVDCNAYGINLILSLTGHEGGPEYLNTRVDAAGVRYMNDSAPAWSNGIQYWSLIDGDAGGPVDASFPLPPDTPIEVGFHLTRGLHGPDVYLTRLTIDKCNGGSVVASSETSIRDDRIFADGLDDLPPLLP